MMYDLYKPFRNKICELELRESLYVIWGYSQHLQYEDFMLPADIGAAREFLSAPYPQSIIGEWELELIAKEVIINAGTRAERNTSLSSWSDLASIVNLLKHLENSSYRRYGSQDNIWVELVRIAHRQFGWQENKPNAVTATRYYRLFNTTEINQICVKKFGVTIKEIFQCGLALLGAFLSRPIIQEDYFRAFAQVTERQIDTNSFVKLICKTDRELRAILKKEQRYDSQFAFAYNSLRAFPLVRLSNGESDTFMCPLPTLLFWRFTAGLYYELVSEENFGHLFGQSVQKYVGDLAVNAFQRDTVTILPEHEYVMGKKRKDSADWIILDQKAALFIECKSKRLSWDTKTNIEDTKPLEKDITQVATAIAQLYKTIGDYTEGRYSNLAYDENLRVYPVLVTLESLHFFGPLILNKIKAAVVEKLAEAGLGENLLTDMPYSICSMTDLEGSFSFMNKVGVSDFMDQKFSDPETSDWSFNSYTSHRIGTIRPRENLFPESYQEIFVGLSLGL